MKRSLFVIAAVLCVFFAQAADYPYLVFTNTAGTTTVMSVLSLTMTVSGTSLQVTNQEGTETFTLTDLTNMQFSKDGSTVMALENVLDADRAVEVVSMTGVPLGAYETLRQAAAFLPVGAYVIKQGVNTQTVVIR